MGFWRSGCRAQVMATQWHKSRTQNPFTAMTHQYDRVALVQLRTLESIGCPKHCNTFDTRNLRSTRRLSTIQHSTDCVNLALVSDSAVIKGSSVDPRS